MAKSWFLLCECVFSLRLIGLRNALFRAVRLDLEFQFEHDWLLGFPVERDWIDGLHFANVFRLLVFFFVVLFFSTPVASFRS